jgi:hypothetical protein
MSNVMRRGLGVLALLVSAGFSGCASSGSVSSTPSVETAPAATDLPDVGGSWRGYVSVEGQALDGVLQLTQTGDALEAVFQAPSFGLRANGTGSISADGSVEVVLSYNLQCAGEAVMTGELSDDGLAMSGDLDAGDCTGSMVGSFRFTR